VVFAFGLFWFFKYGWVNTGEGTLGTTNAKNWPKERSCEDRSSVKELIERLRGRDIGVPHQSPKEKKACMFKEKTVNLHFAA